MSDEVKKEEEATDIGDNQEDQPTGKHPGGRPTEYDPDYHPMIAKILAKHGHTIMEIAAEFGVTKSTIYEWIEHHKEFSDSINDGRNFSDDRTERSLYERANGFTWIEDEVVKLKDVTWEGNHKIETEHVEVVPIQKVSPPDFQSMSLWLRNRRPKTWRDKLDIDANVNTTAAIIDTNSLDADTKAKIAQAYALKNTGGNDGTNNS